MDATMTPHDLNTSGPNSGVNKYFASGYWVNESIFLRMLREKFWDWSHIAFARRELNSFKDATISGTKNGGKKKRKMRNKKQERSRGGRS
jgi:hypothetical protein